MKQIRVLFIWDKRKELQDKILQDINAHFSEWNAYRISWKTQNSEILNVERMLGRFLSSMEKRKMTGDFTCVVLRWENLSKDENLRTGNDIVLSQSVARYQQWGHAKYTVHLVESSSEVECVMSMLFALNHNDYISSVKPSSTVELMECDTIGLNGWDSLEQFFYVLNSTMDYLVLRNWECLPKEYTLEGHGDIDILVRDVEKALLITGARKISTYKDDASSLISIAGQDIPFDIRYVGDNYYDRVWENRMLDNRSIYNDIVWGQNDKDHFFSLLYHVLVQKDKIKTDYQRKLQMLAERVGVEIENWEPQTLMAILDDFMKSNQYRYVRPNNIYATFNEANVRYSKWALKYGVTKSMRYRWNSKWMPMKRVPQRIIKLILKTCKI